MSDLSSATRVAILGSGEEPLGPVLDALRSLAEHDVRCVIHLGRFAFPPGTPLARSLNRLEKRLAEHSQTLFLSDPLAGGSPPTHADRVRPSVQVLPRGFRARFSSGRTLAALGGSVARLDGTAHERWSSEFISDSDLDRLGVGNADVLLLQDHPLADRGPEDAQFPDSDSRERAPAHPNAAAQGFFQVSPRVCFSGACSTHVDELLGYWGDAVFACRLVSLDSLSTSDAPTVAILDTESLDISYLTTDGRHVVTSAPAAMPFWKRKGRWRVSTLTSEFLFDFDERYVTRINRFSPDRGDGYEVMALTSVSRLDVGREGIWEGVEIVPEPRSRRVVSSIVTKIFAETTEGQTPKNEGREKPWESRNRPGHGAEA